MHAADHRQLTELDVLSPAAAKILRDGPPGKYAELLVRGGSEPQAKKSLGHLQPRDLLAVPIQDMDDAQAMLAGFWLWFDDLHASHRIAQDIPSPTGCFWHAIMHRREGDFSNAKYWYARCQSHRVNRLLGAVTSSVVGNAPPDAAITHLTAGEWDGAAFVDFVESVYRKPEDPRHAIAVHLQQAEWCALFHHCALAAAGMPLE
jgi:hypothetical protein